MLFDIKDERKKITFDFSDFGMFSGFLLMSCKAFHEAVFPYYLSLIMQMQKKIGSYLKRTKASEFSPAILGREKLLKLLFLTSQETLNSADEEDLDHVFDISITKNMLTTKFDLPYIKKNVISKIKMSTKYKFDINKTILEFNFDTIDHFLFCRHTLAMLKKVYDINKQMEKVCEKCKNIDCMSINGIKIHPSKRFLKTIYTMQNKLSVIIDYLLKALQYNLPCFVMPVESFNFANSNLNIVCNLSQINTNNVYSFDYARSKFFNKKYFILPLLNLKYELSYVWSFILSFSNLDEKYLHLTPPDDTEIIKDLIFELIKTNGTVKDLLIDIDVTYLFYLDMFLMNILSMFNTKFIQSVICPFVF